MDIPNEAYSRTVEALLKLSKSYEKLKVNDIAEQALLPRDQVLRILSQFGFYEEEFPLTEDRKVDIVLQALERGIDGERIARYLDWREFEKLVGKVFSRVGYETLWNLNLILEGQKCQIDLLAYRSNLILLIDCKHWKKPPPPSAELKIIEAQERRLEILRRIIEGVTKRDIEPKRIYLVPLVLSLYQPSRKILEGHVFSSIGKLRGMLEYIESAYFQLRHEKLKIPAEEDLSNIISRIFKRGKR